MRRFLVAVSIVALATSACTSIYSSATTRVVGASVSTYSGRHMLDNVKPVVYGAKDATFGLYKCPGAAAGGICTTVAFCKAKQCVVVPNMIVDTGSDEVVVRESLVKPLLTRRVVSAESRRYGSKCATNDCTVVEGEMTRFNIQTGDIAVRAHVLVAQSITYGGGDDKTTPAGILGIGGDRDDVGYSIAPNNVFYYGPGRLVLLHIDGLSGYGEVLDKKLYATKYASIHQATRLLYGTVDTGSDVGDSFTDALVIRTSPLDTHYFGVKDIKTGLVINQATGCSQIIGGQYKHIIVCPEDK